MRRTSWLPGGIAGLLMGLGALSGCEGGGGEPLPPTGGAGIPGVRGPAAPPREKGGEVVGQGPTAPRTGPAPTAKATGGETAPAPKP